MLSGTALPETIHALAGDDAVSARARAGNDIVYAGDGNDELASDGANSILFGGEGNDNLFGYGAGNETYQFWRRAANDSMPLAAYGGWRGTRPNYLYISAYCYLAGMQIGLQGLRNEIQKGDLKLTFEF